MKRNEVRRERRARENLKGSCFTCWSCFDGDGLFSPFQYFVTEK